MAIIRVLTYQQHPQYGPERMAKQVDLLLPESLLQRLGQIMGIGHELLQCHAVLGDLRRVRLARAPLVPVHHDEMIFQFPVLLVK